MEYKYQDFFRNFATVNSYGVPLGDML